MAKKHAKSWSPSLASIEMQRKTTVRYGYTPIRMAKTKKTVMAVRMQKKAGSHTLLLGIQNSAAVLEKYMAVS